MNLCANNMVQVQVTPTELFHAICTRSTMDIAGEIFSVDNSDWNVL